MANDSVHNKFACNAFVKVITYITFQ